MAIPLQDLWTAPYWGVSEIRQIFLCVLMDAFRLAIGYQVESEYAGTKIIGNEYKNFLVGHRNGFCDHNVRESGVAC